MSTRFFKDIRKKLHSIRQNLCFYYTASLSKPILKNTILLEADQGRNVDGSMFALLRALKTNPKWNTLTVVFVTTKRTQNEAKARMISYGFNDVILVKRFTRKYYRYLARSAYLAADSAFPICFQKRPEQIYLNTWSGTPLMKVGRSDKASNRSYANMQKNFLQSDFVLFPNVFTKDVFLDDYFLRYLFHHKSIVVNTPKNEVFYDAQRRDQLRTSLGLNDKQIIAYMPARRGSSRSAENHTHWQAAAGFLHAIDQELCDNQVLFVHFDPASDHTIPYEEYQHIQKFPSALETYDFLNLSDVLITDYSNVIFDFAITGKKIILFPYDRKEYSSSHAFYMELEAFPFPIVETTEALLREINTPFIQDRSAFLKKFCPCGSMQVSEQLLDLMICGEESTLQISQDNENCAAYDLLFAGSMSKKARKNIRSYIDNHADTACLFVYRCKLNKEKRRYIDQLPPTVVPLQIVSSIQSTFPEFVHAAVLRLLKRIHWDDPRLQPMFSRERTRLFPGLHPVNVIDFAPENPIIQGALHAFPSSSYQFGSLPAAKNYRVRQMMPFFYNKGDALHIFSLVFLHGALPFRLADLTVMIDSKVYHPRFFSASTTKPAAWHIACWKISIPIKDLRHMAKNNQVTVDFGIADLNEERMVRFIRYNQIYGSRNVFSKGALYMDRKQNMTACFRQGGGNKLMLLVRECNMTDSLKEQCRLFIAWLCAHFYHGRSLIVLYEKEASRYEESASVLYEALLDQGYTNAFFFLRKDYPFWNEIQNQYKDHLIPKGSFKHYLYFFAAKTFIGTETRDHALDLSMINRIALRKIKSRRVNYVFLQHGVMYMVSLDSPSRRFFHCKTMAGKYQYRVVVSSQAEADHFVNCGGYTYQNLYISGLPKFDRNKRHPAADKIVIMPTWRPWEYNEIQADPSNSGYCRMLKRITDAIPKAYQDKIILLPHPLFAKRISKSDDPIRKKFLISEKYDTILQHTALLITDYSSIAYDAFYRGAQVIFYWEEKDHCLRSYGKGTRLLLNESNVFAPIAYSPEDLTRLVQEIYHRPHTEEQEEKYRKIVAFHDGNNVKRLISMLKADGLLS